VNHDQLLPDNSRVRCVTHLDRKIEVRHKCLCQPTAITLPLHSNDRDMIAIGVDDPLPINCHRAKPKTIMSEDELS
jgi:hypothetical protein